MTSVIIRLVFEDKWSWSAMTGMHVGYQQTDEREKRRKRNSHTQNY